MRRCPGQQGLGAGFGDFLQGGLPGGQVVQGLLDMAVANHGGHVAAGFRAQQLPSLVER